MSKLRARTPVPLSEVQPGKFFQSIVRPPLARPALPFRVEFDHLHRVDARTVPHMVPNHQHAHYEIIVIERGDYRCLVNDVLVTAKAGGVILLNPGDHHADRCQPPVSFMALALRVSPGPRAGWSVNLLREDLKPADHVIQDDAGLHAIAGKMCLEGVQGDPFTALLLDSLAQEFLWCLLRMLPAAHLSSSLQGGMELHGFSAALLALFEAHVDHAFHPPEMARALSLPVRTLTTRCREAFAAAPANLFQKYRMERARTLLAQTDLSVGKVAECLGFVNQYHFSTVYKRVHGTAPNRHRSM